MYSEDNIIDVKDFVIVPNNPDDWKYSNIFIVIEKSTNNKFVAKELNIEIYSSPTNQKLLLYDLSILDKLYHIAIAKNRGFSFISLKEPQKWQPTLLTEFTENHSLQEKLDDIRRGINSKDWTPTKKYINIVGICAGLNYLHDKIQTNNNLKPSNILLDKNLYPKICDFIQSHKPNEMKMSSQIYIAPEILQEGSKGSSSDVYSFGIIALEIITGEKPYQHISEFNMKIINQIIEGSLRPKIPSNINKNMKELIERCLDSDYIKRPSFDEIFSKLTQNFKNYQNDIDEKEFIEYLKLLSEKNPKDGQLQKQLNINDFKNLFLFYLTNAKNKKMFQFSLSDAFSNGNSEIVRTLLSLKMIHINTIYIFILIFVNEIIQKIYLYDCFRCFLI